MSELDEVLMVISGQGDERAHIIAVETTTTIFAVLAVTGRFVARYISKTKYGWDDWLILPAFVLTIAWYPMMWWSISIGFGTYIGEVTYRKLRTGFIIIYVSQYLYAYCVGLAKLSILFLYSRAFNPERWARIYIRTMAVITVLWMLAFTIIACVECRPLNAFWDRNIEGECSVDPKLFYFASGIVDIVTDIAMFALPMILCARLKLSPLNKALLCLVFASGFLVTFISLLRVKAILDLDLSSPLADNITWNFWYVGMVSGTDVNMAVICANLPCLRPLIAKAIPKAVVPSGLRKRPASDPKSPVFDTFSSPRMSRTSTASSQWAALLEEKGQLFADLHDIKSDVDFVAYRPDCKVSEDVELAIPPPIAVIGKRPSLALDCSAETLR